MIYLVDTLNIFDGDKYCKCKKIVFVAKTSKKGNYTQILFINIGHILSYSRKGNNFTIATREGYLKCNIAEFQTFFEPTTKPEEAYTGSKIYKVEIDKNSFNAIS